MRVSDAQDMFDNWASDPEVAKYLSWSPHESVEVTKQLLTLWEKQIDDPGVIRFGIVHKEDRKVIGTIDIVRYIEGQPEIGYCLSRAYWRQGIMTEAATAVINRLKILGFTKVYISAAEANIASNKTIQKLGLKFVDQTFRYVQKVNDYVPTNNYVKNL